MMLPDRAASVMVNDDDAQLSPIGSLSAGRLMTPTRTLLVPSEHRDPWSADMKVRCRNIPDTRAAHHDLPPSSRGAQLSRVMSLLRKREAFFVTAMSDDVSTFGPDNMVHFHDWMLMQLARLESGSIEHLVLVVRRHVQDRNTEAPTEVAVRIPITQIGGCRITRTALHMLTAAEMRRAFTNDHATGRLLPHDPTVSFVDFSSWLSSRTESSEDAR